MGACGSQGIAVGGRCAAAPGFTYRDSSAPPTSSGPPAATGVTLSDSGLPGRSPHEFLFIYLKGIKGRNPLVDFSAASSCRSNERIRAGRRLASLPEDLS